MIRTERLVLRELRNGDLESLHAAYEDAETMEWWHEPPSASLEETARRIDELRTHAATFAIALDDHSPAIGHAGWLTAPRGRQGGFGYLLRRDHWGAGIATEAAHAALHHGFAELGTASAELWVYEGNRRSAALAERLGCRIRGQFVGFNLQRARAFETLVYGVTALELGYTDVPSDQPRLARVIPSMNVRDVSASIAFWTEKLGFEVEFTVGDPPTLASLVRGGAWRPSGAVVRFRAAPSDDTRPPLDGVLEMLTPDVDDMHAELVARGAPIVDTLETKPWGIRECSVVDPDGILVRFYAPALAR